MVKTVDQIKKLNQDGPFHANWESLSQFDVPTWFKQAKFGIFIHWGLYSVPQYGNEWYSRNMYIPEHREFEHHCQVFGAQKDFGYKDFIPLFTAKAFDAKAWVEMFKQSGAKYIFPVAEHHDGFQMYRSELSHYNTYEMGPKRDVLGELKQASNQAGLHFCTSNHRAEHWWFMGHGKDFDSDIHEPLQKGDFYWPAMPEPNDQDLFSKPYPSKEYLDDWLQRVVEIIDCYQPELIYFDWWIQHVAFKPYLQQMAAYYYNQGSRLGYPTGICYKYDGMASGTGIEDVERGGFAEPKPFYWQTDTSIANNSWSYTTDLEYKSINAILITLIDVVSKNGNLLLNVGPKADGSFAKRDQDILKSIGDWLIINGEGIYGSQPWKVAREGETNISEGMFQEKEPLQYKATDIRYTINGGMIYAYILNPQNKTEIILTAFHQFDVNNQPVFHGVIEEVQQLGIGQVDWRVTEKGMVINISPTLDYRPVGLKIIVK